MEQEKFVINSWGGGVYFDLWMLVHFGSGLAHRLHPKVIKCDRKILLGHCPTIINSLGNNRKIIFCIRTNSEYYDRHSSRFPCFFNSFLVNS